jgi:MFS family permease
MSTEYWQLKKTTELPVSTKSGIWWLLLSYFLGLVPSFTLPTLTALILAQLGFSPFTIGLFAALPFVALLSTTLLTPVIIRRVGIWRTFVIAQLAALGAIAGFVVTDNLILWFTFNAVWGSSAGMRWIIYDTLIAELAPSSQKGHFIGLSETLAGAAVFVGSSMLFLTGTAGKLTFVIISGLLMLSGLAFSFVGYQQTLTSTRSTKGLNSGLGDFLKMLPLVLIAAFIGGIFESGTVSTLPVYGVELGLTTGLAASLVTALGLGSFLFQYPVGFLADRFKLQWLLITGVSLLLVASISLSLVSAENITLLWLLSFVWGGVGGGMYTFSLIYIGINFSGVRLITATSIVVFTYTLASGLGPILGGLAIYIAPDYGLSVLFGAISLLALIATVFIRDAKPEVN